MVKTNFISLYQDGFRQYWSMQALTNYESNSYTYQQLAERVAQWHLYYERIGIKRGDKIAIMGKDTAEWVIIFISTITYGAVIVPVLSDFSAVDAATIITHSESRLLFADSNLWDQLREQRLPLVEQSLEIQDGGVLFTREDMKDAVAIRENLSKLFSERYPKGYEPEDVHYYLTPNEEMLLLNYTSGTTGFSKGVMVTGNNMAGNVLWCRENDIVYPGDSLLSFLPLAHTYGCMINVLLALTIGVHVTLLGKVPTPRVLASAFRDVRPSVVISVPLVIEKIYMGAIAPKLEDNMVKWMLRLPILRGIVERKIRRGLLEGMGGRARQVIVGGATLNPEIGAFLKRIGFPISVGYGMTECAPLISFTPCPENWRLGSCGQPLKGYMQARIAPVEDEYGELVMRKDEQGRNIGEIQVRGENTCLGYYKAPELTEKLFTKDGWLRTGDLGMMDAEGFIYIKGRSKTMILGSNGQNIYPEEIEAKISLIPYVQESLVVLREGRLIALIVPNAELIRSTGITLGKAWEMIEAHRAGLNEHLGRYEQIASFERHDELFEKTPKQSIKRFLYS